MTRLFLIIQHLFILKVTLEVIVVTLDTRFAKRLRLDPDCLIFIVAPLLHLDHLSYAQNDSVQA